MPSYEILSPSEIRVSYPEGYDASELGYPDAPPAPEGWAWRATATWAEGDEIIEMWVAS